MKRIKKAIIILLFLSILTIFTSSQNILIQNQCNDEINDKKVFFVHSAGFWNLTGTKIYIDDLNPTCNWENITAEYEWCTGNGTIDNPYLIQDVKLNGLGLGSCIEIWNSRKYFIIENCSLSNAEIGIKIENCSNFEINENKILNLKGIDGLNGEEGRPGTDGDNGKESIGILINNCINAIIFSNDISNITGGNGGNGGDGETTIATTFDGGDGGNGSDAFGLLINNAMNIGIYENNISKIVSGKGGIGGEGSESQMIPYVDGEDGEPGINGSSVCAEIRNFKDKLIIENCCLSKAEIGIKFENCSNFKVIDNKISNLDGKDGLSGLESTFGIDGVGGTECIGIFIINSTIVNLTSNKIWKLTGGKGGDGQNGTNSMETGGNAGDGANALGILINNTSKINLVHNIIENISGGNGGNGGDGYFNEQLAGLDDLTSTYGGFGGNGGESIGLYIKNSINITTSMNEIHYIKGGAGGLGGSGGFDTDIDNYIFCGDDSGDGGDGGDAIGLLSQNSINLYNGFNEILDIIGGDGNNGGTARNLGGSEPGCIGGKGGEGGVGGSSFGLFFNNTINVENIRTQIFNLKGGIGGIGGNGGYGSYSLGMFEPQEGGNGGEGGITSGFYFNNSHSIKNYDNCIEDLESGKGNSGGDGSLGFYLDHPVLPQILDGSNGANGSNGGMSTGLLFFNSQNIINERNHIQDIVTGSGGNGGDGGNGYPSTETNGGNGGNGGSGGFGAEILFEKSQFSTNKNNSISEIIGGEIGIAGMKGIGNLNGTDGYNGSIGDCYGFILINTNETLNYFNIIFIENNLDNGSNNHWNSTLHGNYWEYYEGDDLDGDNIGDDPYELNGSAHSKDFFPIISWLKFWKIKPLSFNLSCDAGNPDDDGCFNLSWTESVNANNYTIYQYDKNITQINVNLTILAEGIENLTYVEENLPDGIYYYIVVAFNEFGNISSNCIQVIISKQSSEENNPPSNPKPEFIIWIIIGTTSIGGIGVISGIVASRRKNHRKKGE